MEDWLRAAGDAPAVLVTVAVVEGSSPREAGAKMLVTGDAQHGTIGGGHLEWRAVALARGMLADGTARRLERFALGPALGQCCGGVVTLAFELADAAQLAQLRAWDGEDVWRLVALDGAPDRLQSPRRPRAGGDPMLPPGHAASTLADTARRPRAGGDPMPPLTQAASALADTPRHPREHLDPIWPPDGTPECGPRLRGDDGVGVVTDATGRRWLRDLIAAPRARLFLFGAGHVGAALVQALAPLPCRVTWIDERDDLFPATLPDNVTAEATDTPEALIAAAPAGASYLVMTHSHALDQRLAQAILARDAVGWFGLIGSHTKRVQFERRLLARGADPARVAAMACPIGLPGIDGKAPAVIAVAVAAQLLQVWQAQTLQPNQPCSRLEPSPERS